MKPSERDNRLEQVKRFVEEWASNAGLVGKCTASRLSTSDSKIAISAVGVKPSKEIAGGNDPFSGAERVQVSSWLEKNRALMS